MIAFPTTVTFGTMANADLEIAKRIKQLRSEVGLSQEEFAKRLGGVTRGAVGNWERGLGIKRDNLAAIAKAFSASFDWLATGAGVSQSTVGPAIALTAPPPTYAGIVRAGQFLAVDEFNQDPDPIPAFVVAHPGYGRVRQYAWKASGDSMNLAGIADGMWIVGADAADYIDRYGDIESGDLVVVERSRFSGAEREITVKEVRFYRDRYELLPQSSNAEYRPIVVPHDHGVDADGMEVKIIGVVLTAYTDLKRNRRL